MAKISFDQKPQVALKYLKAKQPELHFNYDDIMHESHHKAFTVAKITQLDLLSDIQNSLLAARDQGQPFEAWKKELIPTLKAKGWYGKTNVTNPKTGEMKEVYIGSRRLRNIFYTNTRVAYAVGRWEHQAQLEDAPYLRYVAILDQNTRPKHGQNHGIVRHRDDPFWATNYPPNGWHCRCTARAYSMESLKSRGWDKGLKAPALNVADADWAYDVRTGSLAKVQAYREQRVLEAPKGLKDAAKEALALDNLYTKSIQTPWTSLSTYLLINRPKMLFKQAPKGKAVPDAQYAITTHEMYLWSKTPQTWQVQHELGHHVDNINGDGSLLWSETSLQKLIKRDISLWTNTHKKEIATLLALKENENIALHDLFYMNSQRKLGQVTRGGTESFSHSLIVKETFANIFEILLSDDSRVDILKIYFPLTFTRIEKLLKELR